MDRLHALATRLLDGEELDDLVPATEEETGSELMFLGEKQTLLNLRKEAANVMAVTEMVRKHAKCIVDDLHRKMMARVNSLNGIAAKMNTQIQRLDYVIQTIETYAGIKEDIMVVKTGVPASVDTPVVIRQGVIYMDEEMALLDPEFDWQKIDSFDKWLVQNDNYKTLMPDLKSIVPIKPRRKDKVYSTGETAADRWHNWTMNAHNHVTLFLVRNGENLYRIESEHIGLLDRMFPNADEYREIIRKEEEEEMKGWRFKGDYSESTIFRKRYTKVSFLLQGLFERSDVFAPHDFTGSIIKMEGLEDKVEMLYELDLSRTLGDGRPAFNEWIRKFNEGLTEGKRVMLVNKGNNHSGYDFSRDDFVNYYASDFNRPEYPTDGIYTLYKSKPKGFDTHYEKYHPFVIKYRPDDPVYDSYGWHERKNRISIHICPSNAGILNYDDLSLEDVDYYLHSRLHRSQYYHFVVMLQKIRKLMTQEQAVEENFIRMMTGRMAARGLKVKEGLTPEEVAHKALDTVKNRLKWKRPVSTKEKETYTMVERNLFSEQNIDRYFKK